MKEKKLILFLDTTHEKLPFLLEEQGYVVKLFSGNIDDLRKTISAAYGLVVRSKFNLDKSILEMATNLRFIARAGAGMENIDVGFAKSRGVFCFNSPDGNMDAVGEQAIGMLLMLMNKLKKADNEVRQRIWKREENRGNEISGKTVGIIGYGNMGSAFAKKLSGFDCSVIAFDKYKRNYSDKFVQEVAIDTIFDESDILSLHVPLTEETKYLANNIFFNSFAKQIWFINTSRGAVCNTKDLISAIISKKVIGAALDVLEWEDHSFENFFNNDIPNEFDWLSKSDKVVLSPHIAGWTHESNEKHAEILFDKIISALK